MIVISAEVLDESIIVEFSEENVENIAIDKQDFEIWVDENERRLVLEENFNGDYSNRSVKLGWEEYYQHLKLYRDLEWFIASNI